MERIEKSLTASADAVTAYGPVDGTHTVIGGKVVVNTLVSAVECTVMLKSGSTTLGTATIPDASAVGTVVDFVMDTTLATRKTNITEAIPLSIVTGGEQTSVTGFDVLVILDPFACPRD